MIKFRKSILYIVLIIVCFTIVIYGVNTAKTNIEKSQEYSTMDKKMTINEANKSIRCSLQDGALVKYDEYIITRLSKGFIFDDKLGQGSYSKGEYWGLQLGLEYGNFFYHVFQYEEKIIYIMYSIIRNGDSIDNVAIIQDMKTNNYEIVSLVDRETELGGIAESFWIYGDKLYYGMYYMPRDKNFLRYCIRTMDLVTFDKDTILNYDELGVYPSEERGKDIDSGCRVVNFVVRDDGAIAFSIIDSEMMRKIMVYKNGVFTQAVENGDNYLIDYDMRGLYYVRPEPDYSEINRED